MSVRQLPEQVRDFIRGLLQHIRDNYDLDSLERYPFSTNLIYEDVFTIGLPKIDLTGAGMDDDLMTITDELVRLGVLVKSGDFLPDYRISKVNLLKTVRDLENVDKVIHLDPANKQLLIDKKTIPTKGKELILLKALFSEDGMPIHEKMPITKVDQVYFKQLEFEPEEDRWLLNARNRINKKISLATNRKNFVDKDKTHIWLNLSKS